MFSSMTIMRRSWLYLLAAACMSLVTGCDEETCIDCPGLLRPPFFVVAVVDTLGDPVEGIRVGGVSYIDQSATPPVAAGAAADMQIPFALPHRAYVTLTLRNYYGDPVRVLLDSQVFEAGNSVVTWDGRDGAGDLVWNGYYFVTLRADSDGGTSPVFEDTKPLLLYGGPGSYFENSTLGVTDSLGQFRSDDTLKFPGLLGDPPAIEARDEFNNPLGVYWYFTDSLTITLSHPDDTTRYLSIDTTITTGGAYYELTWDPTLIP